MKKLILILLASTVLVSCFTTREPWEQTKKRGYGCENTKYTGGF